MNLTSNPTSYDYKWSGRLVFSKVKDTKRKFKKAVFGLVGTSHAKDSTKEVLQARPDGERFLIIRSTRENHSVHIR